MSSDQTALTKAEESMVAEISPFQQRSNELFDKAAHQEVTDDMSLASAVAVKKEITAHRTLVKEARLSITRKIDNVKQAIMNKEAEVLLPLEKAQDELGEKILTYQEEQERIRREEQERIDKSIARVSVGDVYGLKTPEDVDAKGEQLKGVYAAMSDADQKNAQIKLAFTESVNKLSDRKAYLIEQEAQRIERERLDKEAEQQSAERAEIARKKAATDAKERKIQAEMDRLEREKQRKADEDKAEEDRIERERAEKNTVKTGARTVTTIEITNPAEVPRAYCVPSEPLIREAIKSGITVPGVKVTTVKKV